MRLYLLVPATAALTGSSVCALSPALSPTMVVAVCAGLLSSARSLPPILHSQPASPLLHLLPVLHEARALDQLRALVDEVAGKEQVVLGHNGHGVAHEDARVEDERDGHLAADDLGVLAHVHDGRQRYSCASAMVSLEPTEVGGRAPEVRGEEVVAEVLGAEVVPDPADGGRHGCCPLSYAVA